MNLRMELHSEGIMRMKNEKSIHHFIALWKVNGVLLQKRGKMSSMNY